MMLPFEWWCVWLGDDDDEAQGRGLDCGLKWRLSGVGGVKSMNGDEYRWINLCAIWINWFCIVAPWINSSAKRKKVHCSSIGSFKLNQSHSVRGSTAAMLCLQREAISQIEWLIIMFAKWGDTVRIIAIPSGLLLLYYPMTQREERAVKLDSDFLSLQ